MEDRNGYITISNSLNTQGKEIIRDNEIFQKEGEPSKERAGVLIAEFQPIFHFSTRKTLEYPKGPYIATTEFFLPKSVYLNKDLDFVIQFWGAVQNPKNLEISIKVNTQIKEVLSIDKWEYLISPIKRIQSSQFHVGKNAISVMLGGGSGKLQLGHGVLFYDKLEQIS